MLFGLLIIFKLVMSTVEFFRTPVA